MLFRVKWEIDIEADTPLEAVALAHDIQKRRNSTATVFQVQPHSDDPQDCWDEIDLGGGAPLPPHRRRAIGLRA